MQFAQDISNGKKINRHVKSRGQAGQPGTHRSFAASSAGSAAANRPCADMQRLSCPVCKSMLVHRSTGQRETKSGPSEGERQHGHCSKSCWKNTRHAGTEGKSYLKPGRAHLRQSLRPEPGICTGLCALVFQGRRAVSVSCDNLPLCLSTALAPLQ